MKVVCDIETNGLVNPDTIWIVYAIDVATGTHYHFLKDELQPTPSKRFLDFYDKVETWIGHNFIDFDSHVLNTLVLSKVGRRIPLAKIEDTLVMSRLDLAMRDEGHSLDAWGKVFNYPKVKHEDWTQYSKEMFVRCKVDVELNLKVYNLLRQRLSRYSRESLKVEQECQWILSKAKRRGVAFDRELCVDVLGKIGVEIEEHLKNFQKDFPPIKVGMTKEKSRKVPVIKEVKNGRNFYEKGADGKTVFTKLITAPSVPIYQEFNPASSSQVVARLNEVGWNPYLFTKKGQPKVCVENLLTINPNAPQSVKNLVKYKILCTRQSLLNSFVDSVDNKGYNDGRLHGDIITIGAKTHRMSHQNPNTGNIPKENHSDPNLDCYAKDIRKMFIVDNPEERCIVGVDISAIQARMLAHYIGDETYIDIVANGDIHTAHMGYTDGMITDRSVAKTFFYAFLFGCGKGRAGSIIGGNDKDGAKLLKTFTEKVPGLAVLKHKTIPAIARQGALRAIDGRLIQVNTPREVLPCMLQGGEAIIMKKALSFVEQKLYQEKLDGSIVLVVHDEMQIDCARKDAERIAEIGKQAIIDAGTYFKLKIPLGSESLIGNNWHETH